MRKTWVTMAALGLAGALGTAAPVHADAIGEDGCTPGYWKNHTSNWFETDTKAIPVTKTLRGAGYVTTDALKGDTLLEALSYKGGKGAEGAERILLRAAAAAYLNAAHEGLGYPLRRNAEPGDFVAVVNEAIASGDRAAMLEVADWLDRMNNLGCPLS